MAEAVVTTKFNADIADLVSKINTSKKEASGMSDAFKAVGQTLAAAFTVGAVINFGKSIVDMAGNLQDSSDTLNLTTDSLQALHIAARDAGTDIDKLTTALTKTQAAQMELLQGTPKIVEAFDALGISAKDVEGLGTDQVFELIAKGVVDASNQTVAFGSVADLFGSKLAGNLLPVLQSVGTDGLQTIIDKGKEAGEVLGADAIAKIDMFGDSLDALSKKAKVFAVDFASNFKSGLSSITTFWGDIFAGEGLAKATSASQKALDDSIAETKKAVDDAVAKQREGNDLIVDSGKEAAAQLKKQSEEVYKQRENDSKAALKAEQDYRDAAEDLSFRQMTVEEKVSFLRAKQNEILKQITAEEDAGRGSTEKTWKLKKDLLKTQGELADKETEATKQLMDAVGYAGDIAPKIDKSTKAVEVLKSTIKDMNTMEIGKLLVNMQLLQQGLARIGDFPKINIPDLSKLVLPDWMTNGRSLQAVGNFIASLNALLMGLEGKDLSALKGLDFKLPDTTKTDLDGLSKVLRATENARFGSIDIKLAYPSTGIPLDVSNLKLDSIEASLATLAGLKGVIFA